MNLKEKAVVSVLVVVALFAGAVAMWFLSAESAWKKAAKQYEKSCKTYDQECQLISQRRKWNESYEQAKKEMPTFDLSEATDTTWLRRVEEMAKANHVLITQIDSGKEVEAGDVLELPITVRNLEGSLESVVTFLYALQSTEGVMFDVQDISLVPNKAKKGYLKGSLTLTCAYMREEKE